MNGGRGVGRPRAASREILEEAACELFFEKGYAATSVADITQRAGVSRGTFFNYVPAKSDLLWTSVDDALDALAGDLAGRSAGEVAGGDGGGGGSGIGGDADRRGGRAVAVAEVRAALLRLAGGLEPGTVVLAFANAGPMGVTDELEESAARRQRRIGRILEAHLRTRGLGDLEAEVIGAAHAGAVIAALRAWARAGAGRTAFAGVLERSMEAIGGM